MTSLDTARWALDRIDELAKQPREERIALQGLYAQIAMAASSIALAETALIMKADLATLAGAVVEIADAPIFGVRS